MDVNLAPRYAIASAHLSEDKDPESTAALVGIHEYFRVGAHT
jgi:hypothetical protein